jgi:endonuclease/exonuclease/phosphatase family metal-dependent hydrolase
MDISVGTFNLNNLFSRYNFKAEIQALDAGRREVDGSITYKFGADVPVRIRTYKGKLVKAKEAEETQIIAERIKSMDVEVLAVQEVEDIDTLLQFNRDYLGGMYRYLMLIEGNDPRLIDLGVMSKLPIGGATSWKHWVHPDDPSEPIFGRDLLEVDIWNTSRSQRLFTLFNNHLKSHLVDYRKDRVVNEQQNNQRRSRQAETISKIVKMRIRPNSPYIILGDMNDPPDSPYLNGFARDADMGLVNALMNPAETRPAKEDTPPPASSAWTHRYKESGQPARYELYDQIWLSPALADVQKGAWIDRRARHGGDGSDHDPAWVSLRL